VQHLKLDLALDLDERSVSGTATLEFERVTQRATHFELDAVGFDLRRVRMDLGKGWSAAASEYDGDCLRLKVPARARSGRVQVSYHTRPQRGLYFIRPDKQRSQLPLQVWTQCQDEDARHWFPCVDRPHMKMSSELRVRVPRGMEVLSNGELVSRSTPRSQTRPWVYHFRLDRPHPSYLITLVAGHFDVIEDRAAKLASGALVPVAYYVPEGRRADALRAFRETPRMIELFSRITGVDYPWSRYSQVVVSDFIFGGMENTTATTVYEHILLDERAALDISSHDLVAHELAHQWFGDHVTCRDWSHAWLNEGFATYFEHLEREDRLGLDEYEFGLQNDLWAYLSETGKYQRPLVCRDYAFPIELFDRHLYEKGALVLHMLRRKLSDSVFWAGIRQYLRSGADGIVETNDLQRALEDVSGVSLDAFFDQWVYRPGHPVLKVKISWDDGQLHVSVRQTQKTGEVPVYRFVLQVAVGTTRGEPKLYEKAVDTVRDTLVVRLSERPNWVAFDPQLRVAGKATVEAPADMLRAQLRHGSTARIRAGAADALSGRSDGPTILALGEVLSRSEAPWMVRDRCARALARIRGEESLAHLRCNADTEHPKVRRAVAAALGHFPDAASTLTKLARQDASYLVAAEAARALGRTRNRTALRTLVSLLRRQSWGDVCLAGALDGLAELRDEKAIAHVLRHTRYGVAPRGRRAAVSALAKLTDNREARRHLEDLLDDTDPHLRISVAHALKSLGDTHARPALRRRVERERDGRAVRAIKETLRDLSDGSAREQKRLTDELEELRTEFADLKVRLAKLEGSRPSRRRVAPKRKSSRKRRQR
jgi:aminopeptidase N